MTERLCALHPDHFQPCSKCAGADCCYNPDTDGKFPPGWAGLPGTHGMKSALTVSQVNGLLGIDIWRVRSFRANVQIDFDEYGNVLSVTLLNPDQEASDGT